MAGAALLGALAMVLTRRARRSAAGGGAGKLGGDGGFLAVAHDAKHGGRGGGSGGAAAATGLAAPLLGGGGGGSGSVQAAGGAAAAGEDTDGEEDGAEYGTGQLTKFCHGCRSALPTPRAIACGSCGCVVPGASFDGASLFSARAGELGADGLVRCRTLARAEAEATLQELDRRESAALANLRLNAAAITAAVQIEQARRVQQQQHPPAPAPPPPATMSTPGAAGGGGCRGGGSGGGGRRTAAPTYGHGLSELY